MTAVVVAGGRVFEPEHVLTISGSSSGKVGSCRCGGWSAGWGSETDLSSDAISELFVRHVSKVGELRPACGGCDMTIALVRRGRLVEVCSGCDFGDAAVSGWSDGHPARREDPGRPDSSAVVL